MKWMAALLLLVPICVAAQSMTQPKVYVDPNNPFSNAFSAGVEKKHVPVVLTTDPDQSDYTVSFTVETNKGSKAQGVTTAIFTGVYNSGAWDRVSMTVIDSKSKDMVFSYTCQKGGGRLESVAQCLAKHWKDQLEKK